MEAFEGDERAKRLINAFWHCLLTCLIHINGDLRLGLYLPQAVASVGLGLPTGGNSSRFSFEFK